jgi:hypothetical protein
MLKFIYTETALHLEVLSVDLADWVEQRHMFAASTGESLSISSERAAMLLPNPSGQVAEVARYLHDEKVTDVTVYPCDIDRLEIAFAGYWLCGAVDLVDGDFVEGIFITQLSQRVEAYLWQLWYAENYQLVAGDGVMG